MKNRIYFLAILILLAACKTKSEEKAVNNTSQVSIDKQTIRKIDVHAHYEHARAYLPEFLEKWNMQAVLVDVAYEKATGIDRSWENYTAHAKSQSNLFFLCSSLIGVGIDSPDFAQEAIDQLDQEIDAGAKMVKVWKNFGMVTKDKSGKFIQINDPRLQPIWDFLIEKDIPVMAHIGEPVQAWRPLDDPNNPHYGYYSEHPEYHAYKLPEIPSYETILMARDQWIKNNPSLRILCAHLGSMSHDTDMVAERLDKFPNMSIELGARFGDLAGQNPEKVRTFFDTYQDRVLFGSDYGNSTQESTTTPEQLTEEQKRLDTDYNRLWNYLSGSDSLVIRNQRTKGLQLSPEILEKVYYKNAAKLLALE